MKLLLLFVAAQSAADECPMFLIAESYPPEVAALSRPYTDCMTEQFIPTREQYDVRREQCGPIRELQIKKARQSMGSTDVKLVEETLRWIDHVTSNFVGCETKIAIRGDGTKIPDAKN